MRSSSPLTVLVCAALLVGSSASAARGTKKARKPPVASEPVVEAPSPEASALGSEGASKETPTATVERCASPDVAAKVRTLVMDLEAGKEQRELARALGQVVAEETARAPGYDVVSSAEIRAALSQEAERQIAGCDESGCLAEIADALDADLLVSGRVSLAPDGAPLLSLVLLNTRAVVTVGRVNVSWHGDDAMLPEVARAATQLLVLERGQRKPGTLAFEGLPEGARVWLDEDDVTERISAGKLADLEVGPYGLAVDAPGYQRQTLPVLVQSGREVTVEVTLEPEPIWGKWWLWVAAGGVVAATASATLLVAAALQPASVNASATPKLPTFDPGSASP